MEELILTSKELCCLALRMGATRLIGLPDGFADVPRVRLESDVLTVMRSLAKRGALAEEGGVTPEWAALLEPVAHCEGYASALKQTGPEESACLRLYRRAGRTAALTQENGRYVLRPGEPTALPDFADWDALGALSPSHGQMEQRSFAALQQRPSAAAVRAMTKAGLSEPAAKLVADAFFQRAGFYSFAFLQPDARRDAVRGIQFVGDARGIVTLETLIKDDVTWVRMDTAEAGALRQRLERDIRWFLDGKEGSGN